MTGPSKDGAEPKLDGSPVRAFSAALLGWLLPGGGHLFLGRRGRAAIYFLVVLGLFAMGLALGGKVYSFERGAPLSLLALLAEIGCGAPFLILKMVHVGVAEVSKATFEHGTTFLITAGLLNLLASLDAWDIGAGRKP